MRLSHIVREEITILDERARALRPIVDKAEFLLDLHSMQYATAPLMLAGLLPRSRELARRELYRAYDHSEGRDKQS